MKTGYAIRALRNMKGVSLKKMAEACGMSSSGWSRAETGVTHLTVEQLRAAARVLEMPPWELLKRAGRRAPMNAEEFQLACRAVAVGVPVESYDVVWNQVRLPDELGRQVLLDVGDTYDCNRLRYVVAMDKGNVALLPLLSDLAWIGWVLEEVKRRGFWACLATDGSWSVTRAGFSRTGGPGWSRAEALTAMLEATWIGEKS